MASVTKRGRRKGNESGISPRADLTFEAVLPSLYFGLMGVRPGQSLLGSMGSKAKPRSFVKSILLVLVCAWWG